MCNFIFISCDNPTQNIFLHSPDYQTPIVSGLRITSTSGPEVIATWRKPYDTDQEKKKPPNNYFQVPDPSDLRCPYPNPANASVSVPFVLAEDYEVSCWAVPATLPENSSSEKTHYFNSLLPSPTGYAIATLLYKEIKSEGAHDIEWDNKSLPAGFYRIYLQINSIGSQHYETLFWRDVLLYHRVSDIPYDLLQILPKDFQLFH